MLHALVYFNSAYIIEALSTGSTENCLLLACYVRNVLVFLTCLLGLKILATPGTPPPSSILLFMFPSPSHYSLPLPLPPIITPSPPPLPFFRDCSLRYLFPDTSLPSSRWLVPAMKEQSGIYCLSPSKQK